MPIRKQDYPPDWPFISLTVRKEAGWKCEWCAAPGGKVIQRFPGGAWAEVVQIQAHITAAIEYTEKMTWARLRYHRLTKVVLSTAHLDRNSKNNDRENLASLCQKCHLNHDILQHMQNRKYGRHHGKEHQFKLEL